MLINFHIFPSYRPANQPSLNNFQFLPFTIFCVGLQFYMHFEQDGMADKDLTKRTSYSMIPDKFYSLKLTIQDRKIFANIINLANFNKKIGFLDLWWRWRLCGIEMIKLRQIEIFMWSIWGLFQISSKNMLQLVKLDISWGIIVGVNYRDSIFNYSMLLYL